MVNNQGLQLIIELSPDEAQMFRKLALTEKPERYDGIAKALVLGAGKVVDPKVVKSDIRLLEELTAYSFYSEARAEQRWADELSYTREQLEQAGVREALKAWAVYFGSMVDDLVQQLGTPVDDQLAWIGMSNQVEVLIERFRRTIKRYVV